MKFSSSYQKSPDWPGASIRGSAVGYCQHCQEALFAAEQRCSRCGSSYDPQDAESFRERRDYEMLEFWLPALGLAILAGSSSQAFSFGGSGFGYGLSIGIPVSVGVVVGYGLRFGIWLVGMLLLLTLVMFIVGFFVLHVVSVLLVMIWVVVMVLPAVFGILLGVGLRLGLQQTRWSQRHFFP